MSNELLGTILRQLRKLESTEAQGSLSDTELLERFLHSGDQAAFEVMVWRHGPMVLRACRRILGCPHSAEDAFQATFVVLFRKASSIGNRSSLAAWLHRVACRTALRLKQKLDQLPKPDTPLTEANQPVSNEEQIDWLDQAIDHLPQRYREVFILCCLQELSYSEAAETLQCPLGTVQSRLARARERLQNWLRKNRIVPLVAMTSGLLVEAHATSLSLSLVRQALSKTRQTSCPISTLANETIRAMTMKKAQITALVLLLIGLTSFGGWRFAPPSSSLPPAVETAQTRPRPKWIREVSIPEVQGEWGLSRADLDARRWHGNELPRIQIKIKEKRFTLRAKDKLEITGIIARRAGRSESFVLRIQSVQRQSELKFALVKKLGAWQAGQTVEGFIQRKDDYLWLVMPSASRQKLPGKLTADPQIGKLTLRWWRIRRVLVKPWGSP